jgi:hypothetical protein
VDLAGLVSHTGRVGDVRDVEPEKGAAAMGTHRNSRRLRHWLTAVGVLVVVAGSLWNMFGRSDVVSVAVAEADCARSLPNGGLPGSGTMVPTVIGRGSSASLIAFDAADGWRWCLGGIGIGGGPISKSEMRAPFAVPVAIVDGALQGDVLLLVHRNEPTTRVVVVTARSTSVVLAQRSGFEVLRVPMATWPRWHAPWSRVPVALGRILGFDSVGRVTSSQAFTWCPGSYDVFPGQGC